ncbi:hypothetical protein [Pelagicoccus mobilis]|uniref:Uncharacterized protein n=1 Tax=Pelagicoccus mobilis TaxID=415221 RepID=A0A934S437_9BACT|nr:hypothetical protein [Pelagicoccus mobilis]MBK1879417.1 hypothetical protein [Pelagicoccus mobilis]
MKTLFTLIALLLFAASANAELTIISTNHRDADSFKRFSEFFTGKHSDGRYSVFRSDETSRDGFYVSLLAKDKSILPKVSEVKVQYVKSGSQDIHSFTLPVIELNKKRILVGFTGGEWESGDSHPVAWKIELLDSSSKPIDSAQSFLWSE